MGKNTSAICGGFQYRRQRLINLLVANVSSFVRCISPLKGTGIFE
ncbi:hypothetical protein SAMN05421579_14212 [Xenorhabdus japonica]|uniref:Uncharacterized protein n=1 Tax=Xenorhabdus japonica TaxID=53341 RepID=A0A1I5DKH1_9GAMM|nr:hypothetical protein SAMN05421579_14212 [Xenorhabdus japonica]